MKRDRELTEAELEALSHGRRDLAGDDAREIAEDDEEIAAWIAAEKDASKDASVALKRAMPDLVDLDGMVALAMAKAPERASARPGAHAPSRASLIGGFAAGAAIAIGAGVMSTLAGDDPSSIAHETWGEVASSARLAMTLTTSLDRLVRHVPGGWASVALAGLALAAMLLVPLRALAGGWRARPGGVIGSTLAMMLIATSGIGTAHAYEIEGEWPAQDPRVSVDVDRQPLSEALRRALSPQGIGLAYTLPDDPPVTLHVRQAPLREVLDALLVDVPARVRHSGHMIVIRPAAAGAAGTDTTVGGAPDGVTPGEDPARADPARTDPAETSPMIVAPVPPVPPTPMVAPLPPLPPPLPMPPTYQPPALPTAELRDLVTFGGDARVAPDQQVRDVLTMGGDATIDGRAFGNVLTMGGDADVRGTVVGDVVTMGGDIRVARGGHVHGQLNAMGGDVEVDEPDSGSVSIQIASGSYPEAPAAPWHERENEPSWLEETLESAMRHALLFLLGLVFLGIAPSRMGLLQGQIVKQPLRSFASGFLGVIVGAILTLVLVITIIGIPGAVVLVLGLFLAAYLGLATTASVIGAALPMPALKDRPVLQLAAGVLVLFLVSRVPVIGGLLVIGATLAGFGAALLTRLGERPASGAPPTAIASNL